MNQAIFILALTTGRLEASSARKNLCLERTRAKLEKACSATTACDGSPLQRPLPSLPQQQKRERRSDCARRGGYSAWYTGFYYNKVVGKCVPLDHYCQVSLNREKRRANKATRYVFTIGNAKARVKVENWFSNKTQCEEACLDYGDKDELHACKINTYMVNKECVALADEFESCHAKRRPSLAACEREARSIFKPRECHSADFDGKLRRLSGRPNRLVALGKVDQRGAATKPLLVNLHERDLFTEHDATIMYLEMQDLTNSNVKRCEEQLDYVLIVGFLVKIEYVKILNVLNLDLIFIIMTHHQLFNKTDKNLEESATSLGY